MQCDTICHTTTHTYNTRTYILSSLAHFDTRSHTCSKFQLTLSTICTFSVRCCHMFLQSRIYIHTSSFQGNQCDSHIHHTHTGYTHTNHYFRLFPFVCLPLLHVLSIYIYIDRSNFYPFLEWGYYVYYA